jgi:hypothetical protein
VLVAEGDEMTDLGRALLAQLDDHDLDRLAELLADRLRGPGDGWLDARAAAAYAGCTVPALRYAMARGEVAFEQAGPGAKVWFRRSALDRWRARETGC